MAMDDSLRGRRSTMGQTQMVEPLEGRVLLSSAVLDQNFAISSVGALADPQVLGAQADGKILVAGETSKSEIGVLRYIANGAIDRKFGSKGMAVVPGLSTMEGNGVLVVEVQSDGKIILGGTVYEPGGERFRLVRLLADGRMDQDFGSQGIVRLPVNSEGWSNMAIGLQGKRIVVGATYKGDFAVMSYTEWGQPYKKFGKRGVSSVDFGGDDGLFTMAVDREGKIIVGGVTDIGGRWDFALARLTANGWLDPKFDKDGKVKADLGGNELIGRVDVQKDGRIVVAGAKETTPGSEQYSGVLVRYSAGGKMDSTFGNKGIAPMEGLGEEGGMVFEKSGGVIATMLQGRRLQVARFTEDGQADKAFGSGGRQVLSLGKVTWEDLVETVVQGDDGPVLVMLSRDTAQGVQFRLVRYRIA